MSDLDTDDLPVQDELTTLKARADMLGVSYHPSIGVEKLRDKIAAALASDESAKKAEEAQPETVTAVTEETAGQKRARLRREANELIRVRITCMNPAKREWDGEIFTVGNAAVGSIKKYVPFNAEEGWHIPRIMYEQIVSRQCQIFVSSKSKHGVTVRQGKLIREFAVEVLPPLTQDELDELARRQAMAQSIG